MTKRLLCMCCWCFCLLTAASAQIGTGKPAYALFDNEGKGITYEQLVRQLAKYDWFF